MNKKKLLLYGLLTIFCSSLLYGAYVFLEGFLQDRNSAMNFKRRPQVVRQNTGPRKEVKRYDLEQLKEAREKGEIPSSVNTVPAQPPTNPTDNVQRTLNTINEINRINEMNRRLMEQQQR